MRVDRAARTRDRAAPTPVASNDARERTTANVAGVGAARRRAPIRDERAIPVERVARAPRRGPRPAARPSAGGR